MDRGAAEGQGGKGQNKTEEQTVGRGFFAGTMWGALVGLVAVALASQLTVRRELSFPEPQAAALEVPGGSEFDQARPETDPVVPATEAPPAQGAPVEVARPQPQIAATPLADTSPATPPVASAESPAPSGSPEPTEPPRLEVASSDPARAGQDAPRPPPQPAPSEPPTGASEPAPLDLPAPDAPGSVAQPVAPEAEGASEVTRAAEAPTTPAETVAALGEATPPSVAPRVETESAAAPPVPVVSEPSAAITPEADPGTGDQIAAALPEAGADAPPAVTPSEAPAAPAPATTAPEAPAGGATAEIAPASEAGLPQVGFSGAAGVKVNQLPTIGGDEAQASDADAAEDAPDVAEADIDPEAPPLVRYAVPFENPDLAPVISIVLLHDMPEMPAPETGLDLPVPVSFAIDAGLPGAERIAAAYRGAGREIVLVPTLPPGAAPADVEVALEVNLGTIREAVALMDRPEVGFQSERTAVAQVVDAIAQTGHGLVTFPRGLNTAQQLAERAGVPARLVFRVLEAGNADAALRTLDQAAFRARQEGVVILVGEAEPASVSAIRGWIEANPDAQVVFAPISAALTAE